MHSSNINKHKVQAKNFVFGLKKLKNSLNIGCVKMFSIKLFPSRHILASSLLKFKNNIILRKSLKCFDTLLIFINEIKPFEDQCGLMVLT